MGENKYQRGQIYKIVSPDFSKCYIGSTCEDLKQRFARHKYQYTQFKKHGKENQRSIISLFNEFGVENCRILWIENCPCNSKKELEKREGEIQKETDCINKQVAGRTDKEYYYDNIEWEKERKKKDRQQNPEKYKERNRHNNAKIHFCEICNCEIKLRNKLRHQLTQKHQNYLKQLEQEPEPE